MKGARLLALVVVLACALAGCAGAGRSSSTLTWGFNLPTSWDPVTSSTGNDVNTIGLVYSSLTQLDPKGTAGPGIARSWRYNGNGTAVTFTLRPGLRFTDGTPLDAAAVRDSLMRGKTQRNSLVKDQMATITGITADDPTHVTLRLGAPDYQIPNLLAGKTGAIVSPTAFRAAPAAIPTAPVGAGPFMFESFTPEAEALLVKNPDYWDAANIHIQRLKLTAGTDPTSVIAAVQSGAVDVGVITGDQVEQARAAGLQVDIADSLSVNQVDVHSGLAPLTDRRVVDALKLAVDRKAVIDLTNGGIGEAAYQPFPSRYVAHDPALDGRWAYDPDRARNLLAAAGYPPGALRITVTVNSVRQAAGELVQQQLAGAGVNATIRVVPPGSSTWQQEVYLGRKAQFALDTTVGRESPVQNLTVVYGSAGLMNTSKVSSPEFQAALDRVRRTPLDAPSYPAVLRDAVRIGSEMSPSFSLGTSPRIAVRSPRVSPLPAFVSQYRWEGVTLNAGQPGAGDRR